MKTLEKVFIIQPVLDDNWRTLHDEAKALIESAGGAYCGSCYQNIKQINPSTFIGSGKLNEIAELLDGLEDVTVLFNGELTPSQTLNISAALNDRKVIDRTTLILDIFALNAVTSEGKVQVELAQLKYIYPRLKGKGAALSRLGGGIGSRGPGETQLETDRRHVRYRIKYLEKRLEELSTRRTLFSDRRSKRGVNVIALVGYTNTGKSSLMNVLTGAGVLEKNALFATLDPTARKLEIDGVEYLLIDTVGFIQKLPHDIVEAFKSTLESAVNCDLALIVADASDNFTMQLQTTCSTLASLGFNKPYLKVLNKCDKLESTEHLPSDCICISAKNRQGIEELKKSISRSFADRYTPIELFFTYDKLKEYSSIENFFNERSRSYTESGVEISGTIDNRYISSVAKYIRR